MRAVVLQRFGGPEVLQMGDVPRPTPGPGELLVRIVAAGTNPLDAKIRATGHWAKIQPPAVLGYEASGVVEEVGVGVEGFRSGDEVYYVAEVLGNRGGCYAEYNVVPARIVARKPRSLSFIEAAAVPLAGGTAWDGIVRRLAVRVGETVLVHGGAGGVGSFAVQFAHRAGARVLATASTANQRTLRQLGVDRPIDYTSEDVGDVIRRETEGRGVDALFDTVGGESLARLLPYVREFGRAATILAPAGDLRPIYRNNLALHGIFLARERERLDEMRPMLERGEVKPLIDLVLPLEDARKAHERLDSGHGRGKIVLKIAP